MGPTRPDSEWSCCFGLHVRTATIVIGLWHFFLNLLALGLLAAIMRNPAMIQELEYGFDDFERSSEELPTPLSKIDPYAFRDRSTVQYQSSQVDMGGVVCICMIAISLMLVHGAVKYKPSHLIPFFCLQLFDFAITTLTAAGYLFYLRSIGRIIDESHRLPWRNQLLKLSPQVLSLVVFLVFVFIVLLKAYAIGIVWRCYKYLTIRQSTMRSMLPFIIPDMSVRQDRDLGTMLPNYEQAIAQGMKQPPPPYYQVALTSTSTTSPNGTETIAIGRCAPPAYTATDDTFVEAPSQQPADASATGGAATAMLTQSQAAQIRANETSHMINIAARHPQI